MKNSYLKPEVKKKWLEALRGGCYLQGREELRSSYAKFCCLGVLSDLAEREKIVKWYKDKRGYYEKARRNEPYKSRSEPSPEVLEWAGHLTFTDINRLIDMNDTEQKSFSAIAQWIEDNIPEVQCT